MRALFTAALEKSGDIIVLDSAANADEAREMIPKLKPDIITLDIEMPGMNGIDFLAELMATRPMPVIMLSTLTQKGRGDLDQGDGAGRDRLLPQAQAGEPGRIRRHLREAVQAGRGRRQGEAPAGRRQARAAAAAGLRHLKWNGSIVAMAASTGGIEAYAELLAGMPENCPPTLILQQMEEGLAVSFGAKLNKAIKPEVKLAEDGMKLEQGIVYVAADPKTHVVIDRWPGGSIRLLPRDPVKGFRPSADLLFAALAKTAGARAIAAILTGIGDDGAMGIAALKASGARTFCQTRDTALVSEVIEAVIARDPAITQLPLADLAAAIVDNASQGKAAA